MVGGLRSNYPVILGFDTGAAGQNYVLYLYPILSVGKLYE